jgi:hypothetical protein
MLQTAQRQTASFHVLASTVVVLVAGMLLTSQIAAAGERSSPLAYRYAGVVETGAGIPAHTITTGRGLLFYFYDSFSQGRTEELYQLCVGPPGKAATMCWKRTARYGVGKVGFSSTLPRSVPLGALTARWLVAGRTVARWPFFYQRGD